MSKRKLMNLHIFKSEIHVKNLERLKATGVNCGQCEIMSYDLSFDSFLFVFSFYIFFGIHFLK